MKQDLNETILTALIIHLTKDDYSTKYNNDGIIDYIVIGNLMYKVLIKEKNEITDEFENEYDEFQMSYLINNGKVICIKPIPILKEDKIKLECPCYNDKTESIEINIKTGETKIINHEDNSDADQ